MSEEVLDDRQVRLRAAISGQDREYLDQFEQGLTLGESGSDTPNPNAHQGMFDGYEEGTRRFLARGTGINPVNPEKKDGPTDDVEEVEEFTGNPIAVGFHPLGGIAVNLREHDGTVATARISIEQAWHLTGYLNALTGMLIQSAFMQAAQEQQVVTSPPRMDIPKGRR